MKQVFPDRRQEATAKIASTRLHRPAIAKKIVAFQELVNLKHTDLSERKATHLLEVPNSTMQSWRKRHACQNHPEELEDFICTPAGADFLQRNTIAVMKLMKSGSSGIRGMQEYLRNSGFDRFVASSEGALQKFWKRCEAYIIEFAEREESRLAPEMRYRKVTVGMDEMFKKGRPCLVAMEVVSNYILLEKFTEDRTADTWKRELEGRLGGFNVEVGQVVSDLCGAIRACARDLGAEHIPELFHAQQEISKATSAALASQKRGAGRALQMEEAKVQKLKDKPRWLKKVNRLRQKQEIKESEEARDKLKAEFETKFKREKEAKEARKETSTILHPIDLKTGMLQTEERVSHRFNEKFKIIRKIAKAAKLSFSSLERIEKAKRAFDGIVCYLKFYFTFYAMLLGYMDLNPEQEDFFNEVIFPLIYLKTIWRRLPKKEKKKLHPLLKTLKNRSRDSPWEETLKQEWIQRAQELAELFQRSSSCVEGRNGVLSLNHHRFHRLNERSLRVLTIIHNFDVKRSDGTTAAERLFEAKHENLFESMVANIRLPGEPQSQQHDRKTEFAA